MPTDTYGPNTTFDWTIPAGVVFPIAITATGGGGGGGGGKIEFNNGNPGGGGGGGGIGTKSYSGSAGDILHIVTGAVGTGGASNSNAGPAGNGAAGNSGGDATVTKGGTTLCSGIGGGGGEGGHTSHPGIGGGGGIGTGDTNVTGGTGGTGDAVLGTGGIGGVPGGGGAGGSWAPTNGQDGSSPTVTITYSLSGGGSQTNPGDSLAFDDRPVLQKPIDAAAGVVFFNAIGAPPVPPKRSFQDDIRLHEYSRLQSMRQHAMGTSGFGIPNSILPQTVQPPYAMEQDDWPYELPRQQGMRLCDMGMSQTPVYPPNLPTPPAPKTVMVQNSYMLPARNRLIDSSAWASWKPAVVIPPPPQSNTDAVDLTYSSDPLYRRRMLDTAAGTPSFIPTVRFIWKQNPNTDFPQPPKRTIDVPAGFVRYSSTLSIVANFQGSAADLGPRVKPILSNENFDNSYFPTFIPWIVGNPQTTYLVPKPPVIIYENVRQNVVPTILPPLVCFQSQIVDLPAPRKFPAQENVLAVLIPPYPPPTRGIGNMGASAYLDRNLRLIESVAGVQFSKAVVQRAWIYQQSAEQLAIRHQRDLSAAGLVAAVRPVTLWGWMRHAEMLPQRQQILENGFGWMLIQSPSLTTNVAAVWILEPGQVVWEL